MCPIWPRPGDGPATTRSPDRQRKLGCGCPQFRISVSSERDPTPTVQGEDFGPGPCIRRAIRHPVHFDQLVRPADESLTMVLAHSALTRNDQADRTCSSHALLGIVFVSGQFFEFAEFILHGLKLNVNPAASAFYMLTGFHGVHVVIGVLMLLVLAFKSVRTGSLSEAEGMNVELVGLYWHFVDIIWIGSSSSSTDPVRMRE